MHLQIIIGSIREGRVAQPVADWAFAHASRKKNWTVELLDLLDWNFPLFNLPKSPAQGGYENALQQRWAATIAKGDAYLFINPEYNHGYTAALKNALDYLYAEWNRKPATVVSYGGVEGARSSEQLRLVMVELQMAPLREAVHLRDVWNSIAKEKFTPTEKDTQQLDKVLEELEWWGHALKQARTASTRKSAT